MKKILFTVAALLVACMGAVVAHAAGIDAGTHLHALMSSPDAAMGLAAAGAFATTKYKQRGVILDYVAGANLASGQMVVVGTKVGITLGAIANGATGSVQMAGVFNYAKLATDVVGQGAALYYDAANNRLTVTAGANTLAGYAAAASGNGIATVDVCLNGVPG